MEDKVFKFYFKAGNSYYHVDGNGQVVLTNSEISIPECVAGWEEIELSFKRNMKYWGVFAKYALDLRFVKDGAKILRYVYYTQGFQGVCKLVIKKLDTFNQSYNFWAEADLDFSQANDGKDFFECPLLDGGLFELVEARKDTVYQVDFAKTAVINLPGLWLDYSYKWLSTFDSGEFAGVGTYSYIAPPLFNASVPDYDYFEYLLYKKDQQLANGSDVFNKGKENCFIRSFSDDLLIIRNLKIPTNITVFAQDFAGGNYFRVQPMLLYWADDLTPANSYTEIPLAPPSDATPGGQTMGYNVSISLVDVPLQKGLYQFVFKIIWDILVGSVKTTQIKTVDEFSVNLSGKARLPDSNSLAMRYITFAKEVVKQMTDNQCTIESNFLSNPDSSTNARKKNYDNIPFNTWVTSGDALKQLSNPKAKASFQNILKDCWSNWGLVLFIQDNILRLEPLYTILSDNYLGRLDPIKNLRVKPFKDYTFNKVLVGQKDFEYGQLNGRKEQSTLHTYLINTITKYNTELDLVTPFRKDIYGIEWVRREVYKTVPDPDGSIFINSADGSNDIFLVETNPVPIVDPRFGFSVYTVYQGGVIISGPTTIDNIYNVALTTKRMLLRHLRNIRSLIGYGKIVFQSDNKNDNMQSLISSGIISEHSDLLLSYFSGSSSGLGYIHEWFGGNRIFQPVVFEFECPSDYNLVEQLSGNLNGYFDFEHNGVVYKGFVLDVGVIPATRDKYTFSLLCHPINDLTTLII